MTDKGSTEIESVAGYMGQDQTIMILYKPNRKPLDRFSDLGSG